MSWRYNKDKRELLNNPTSLIARPLRGYCQAIFLLLSLHELSPLSHTIEDSQSCRITLITNTSDELITPLCHKLSPCLYLTTTYKHKFEWQKFGEYSYVLMRSQFVHVTNGVNFSIVRNATSTLEDFQHYFRMTKADDFS